MIPLLLGVGVIALVLAAAAKAAKKASGSSGGASPARSAGARAHTSRESFPSPDAYCPVCDQTNTDHFERDRQRRLRQLDYWLSIGLIDRKEYRTLQARYDKSVPHGGA